MTLIDTAQLVQKILREAFPASVFAVAVHSSGGSTLLDVSWTDGPRADQVGRFVHPLQARRTTTHGRVALVEHFTLTPKGSQTVQLAADRISISRQHSDAAVQAALDTLEERYRERLAPDQRALLTVAAYRAGDLRGVELEGIHRVGTTRVGACLQCDVECWRQRILANKSPLNSAHRRRRQGCTPSVDPATETVRHLDVRA